MLDVFALIIVFLGPLATLWIIYDSWTTKRIDYLYVAIGAWAVLPPIWFLLEYFLVYRKYGEPGTFELFKYGQDLAKAVWAGTLGVLIAFAASDVFDSNDNCPEKKSESNAETDVHLNGYFQQEAGD